MMKLLIKSIAFIATTALIFSGCKKDEAKVENQPSGSVTIGITDARKTTLKAGEDIIDATKLSKFEVTISKIELRDENGGIVQALASPASIDLRSYQGTVKEFPSINVPTGNYTGVIVYFSGVSITYDGNSYTASTGNSPSVTIDGYTTSEGVPNPFNSEIDAEVTISFEVLEGNSTAFNITFDAVASCYEIEFDCQACTPTTQYFAGLRTIFEKSLSYYFEEGIQQIKYSPPLGIEYSGGNSADYFGIHTFVDFNGIGGTITSHSSQHVYRGTDGLLNVEIGTMVVNSSTLTPNTINATGTTDVKADEVFDFAIIASELGLANYTLEAGKTYYFSLQKVWAITSGSKKYYLQRMCEPIPVVWPQL